MKYLKHNAFIIFMLICSQFVFGQKTIEKYAEKYDGKKLQKKIAVDALSRPATGKSFRDGHGRTPYLSSTDQLPKTVALITFNIRDLGDVEVNKLANMITYNSLSENGGNMVANDIHNQTIDGLKEKFREMGAVLLTPKEFLDTPEKIEFYYNEFEPEVSKLGKFLSRIEDRGTRMSTSADFYRTFDLSAAFDYKRSISLGSDLAKKLGVDAVLSIGTVIQTNKKEGYFRSVSMTLHGPNPIPKEDKKYAAQKYGNGYNEGLLFVGAKLELKKPIESIEIRKKKIDELKFEGMDIIFNNFITKMYDEMNKSIEKNQ